MIASRERAEDQKTLLDMTDIIETAVRSYKRTSNTEMLVHIEWLNKFAESLQLRIDTHDYKTEDARRRRIETVINDKTK